MTSSLVGSEMCIRDRGRCQPYCLLVLRLPDTVQGGPPHQLECIEPYLHPCLLYTSDAADDM
eukprot:10809016-Prorocentrum_lima.AAC.1